jgi:SAM-dependent methyltransferase
MARYCRGPGRPILGLLLPCALAVCATGAARLQRPAGTYLAPYVPTPADVVDRMLSFAKVSAQDVVYDLGCGDGRIVIAAAKKYGARGVGVDIDPERINESIANARKAGVEKRVTFKLQDALATNVSEATVVTLYLLAHANVTLRPILQKQLRPGARIVSHNFGMGDWNPHEVDAFIDSNGGKRTLYLWRVE